MEIQHHLYSNVIIANIEIESVECGAELSHHHKTFHFISSVAVGIIWCMYAYGIWLHLVFHFHIIVNINTHANSSLDMRLKSKLHHLLIISLPSRIHYQTMTLTSHPTFSICHYLMCLAEQQANIYWHSPSKGRGKARHKSRRYGPHWRFDLGEAQRTMAHASEHSTCDMGLALAGKWLNSRWWCCLTLCWGIMNKAIESIEKRREESQ